MTQEEKQLLLVDLCARLPYHLKCIVDGLDDCTLQPEDLCEFIGGSVEIKPYLRPMNSMTEKEKITYNMFFNEDGLLDTSVEIYVDWLCSYYFDYRGLIQMGLAIEAPEGMYNK